MNDINKPLRSLIWTLVPQVAADLRRGAGATAGRSCGIREMKVPSVSTLKRPDLALGRPPEAAVECRQLLLERT